MRLALHRNLSYRLSMISYLLGRHTARLYAHEGLTAQHWKVLSVLYHKGPMPAVGVEAWVTLDKSAISRSVASLLQSGLVQRQLRSQDARSADIELTTAGVALSERLTAAMAALQDRLMQGLPRPDRQRLFEALDVVESALHELDAELV